MEFPLYYIQQEASFNIIHTILSEFGEQVGIADDTDPIPDEFKLFNNYPNPFNPATTISYILGKPDIVKLCVYNIQGQQIATIHEGVQSAGTHTITWDASEYPSGLYFARLQTPNDAKSIKMLLIK
jgi:hypothetical protein